MKRIVSIIITVLMLTGIFTIGVVPTSATVKVTDSAFANDYEQLEYIENSAGQYIKTDYNAGKDVTVTMELEITSWNKSYSAIFGSRTANHSENSFVMCRNNSNDSERTEIGNKNYNYPSVGLNTRSELSLSGNNNFSGSGLELYLFGLNQNNALDTQYGAASYKLYSCKITDGQNVVRDFVPVRRKSDNIVGLYDLQNEKFYKSASTTDFEFTKIHTSGNFGAPTEWDNSPYFPTEEDNNTKAYRYYEGYDDGSVVEKIGYAENFQRIYRSYYLPGALNSGAYYIDKNDYYEFSDHLYIQGEVLLILGDGAKIKAKKGITVPEGSTLRIAREYNFFETEGTAPQIITTGEADYYAGIGGADGYGCGDIYIYGGDYDILSGHQAAGIGASKDKNDGHIYIYGGNIKVRSQGHSAAIGGGYNTRANEIYIFGGTIDANNPGDGAGIGGGAEGDLEYLFIGGNPHIIASSDDGGAGIGGGRYSDCKKVVIKGNPYIEAIGGTATDQYGNGLAGAGIGGGTGASWGRTGHLHSIDIYSGEIHATGGKDATGIGAGSRGKAYSINIYGGKIYAESEDNCAIGPSFNGNREDRWHEGVLNIYGGYIYVNGDGGSSIGGNSSRSLEAINIYGGTIDGHDEIYPGDDCMTTIYGGVIKASSVDKRHIYGGSILTDDEKYSVELDLSAVGNNERLLYFFNKNSINNICINDLTGLTGSINKFYYPDYNRIHIDNNVYLRTMDESGNFKTYYSENRAPFSLVTSGDIPAAKRYFPTWIYDNDGYIALDKDGTLTISGTASNIADTVTSLALGVKKVVISSGVDVAALPEDTFAGFGSEQDCKIVFPDGYYGERPDKYGNFKGGKFEHAPIVTLDVNGCGTVSTDKIFLHAKGDILGSLPTPTAKDNVFVCWCLDKEGKETYSAGKVLNNDLTLYAKWGPRLEFDSMGKGVAPADMIIQGGKVTGTLPAPTRLKDLLFVGWFYDKSFQKPFDYSQTITGVVKLYAKWLPRISTSNTAWEISDGVLYIHGAYSMFGVGEATQPWLSKKSKFSKIVFDEGITVIGTNVFYDLDTVKQVVLPSTLKEIDEYAFSGCAALESVTIPSKVEIIDTGAFSACTELKEVIFKCRPSNMGSTVFAGCENLGSVKVPGSVGAINAWTFNGCPVMRTVELGEGIKSIGMFAFQYCMGMQSIKFPTTLDPAKIDSQAFNSFMQTGECIAYIPSTWDPSITTKSTVSLGGKTFKVSVYDASNIKECHVSFDANGGSGTMEDVSVFKSEEYILPDNGFTAPNDSYFAGWSLSKTGSVISTDSITISGDTTLYAVWKKYITVKFDPNGGRGSIPTIYLKESGMVTLPENRFVTPADSYFVGWSLSPSGELITGTINVTKNTTVYAIWKRYISVKFDSNGGSGSMSAIYLNSEGTVTLPKNKFNPPENQYFIGWSLSKTGALLSDSISVTADTTVYAIWAKYSVVSFNANGGSGVTPPVSCKAGDTVTLPESTFTPPEDHFFIGWSLTKDGEPLPKNFTVNDDITVYAKWEIACGYTDSFIVRNAQDMQLFCKNVNEGKYPNGVCAALLNDIDVSGMEITFDSYKGLFEGYGHKIIGLTSETTGGLFNTLEDNTIIRNLTLENVNIAGSSTQEKVGALANSSSGKLQLSNITVKGTSVSGPSFVGGLIGEVGSGSVEINDCKNSATVKATASNSVAGGIIGVSDGTVKINDCTNTGAITAINAGGIVGRNRDGSLDITNCVNGNSSNGTMGTVTGSTGGSAGGIVGVVGNTIQNKNLRITKCVNYAAISGGKFVGGIVGRLETNNKNHIVSNCENHGTVTSSDSGDSFGAGGIVGSSCGGGDFTSNKNFGNITANGNAGGIVGWNENDAISLANSQNSGNIKAGGNAGGIIGYARSDETESTYNMTKCANTGGVTATNNAGGIVGYLYSQKSGAEFVLTECQNSGSITSSNADAGGIIGKCAAKGNLDDSKNTGHIKGDSAGGIVGSSEKSELTLSNCVNGEYTYLNNDTVARIEAKSAGGGIFGTFGKPNDNESIHAAHAVNYGKITGLLSGGMVGKLNSTSNNNELQYCKNYADATSTDDYVGGVIGKALGGGNCDYTENYGTLTGIGCENQIVGLSNGGFSLKSIMEAGKLIINVMFNANGGSGKMDSVLVSKNANYILPDCRFTAPDGCYFAGWSLSPKGSIISGNVNISQKTTFYAIWKNYLKVSFDANGGSGSMDSVSTTQNANYMLPDCKFTAPDGCYFVGWSLSPNGSIISGNINISDDTTVYAIWDNYTNDSVDTNDGSVSTSPVNTKETETVNSPEGTVTPSEQPSEQPSEPSENPTNSVITDDGEEEGSLSTSSTLSEGNIWIVIAVALLAIGAVAALIIIKKKKSAAGKN